MAPGKSGELGPDDERDLINAEFESLVEGLSLDQSTPNDYLDELDQRAPDESEKYTPENLPTIAPKKLWSDAKRSFKKWRDGEGSDGDGAIV